MRAAHHLLPLLLGVAACAPAERPRSDGGQGEEAVDLALPIAAEDLARLTGEDARPRDRDAACAMASAEATLVKRPVDVIFVIDNSGSMTEEIVGVEKNINQNFAQIIAQSGLDYRVILVTSHGRSAQQKVCIGKPLSGHDCNPPPAAPVNTPLFRHYDQEIKSTDSLAKLLLTYNLPDRHGLAPMGWAGYLRRGAVKMFIEITDDKSNLGELTFDQQLLALKPVQFGAGMNRDYVFHSIVGLVRNVPATKPWGPQDPLQAKTCGAGAQNPGPEYQRLSILTGGLRFPICEWANFDAVFKEVAQGVLKGSKVACELELPKPPGNAQVDLDSLVVEYTPSQGGQKVDFLQVKDLNGCKADSFYLSGNRISLCPDACARVQRDELAKLRVLFDCQIPPG